ncbi:NPCBM/NEW2 domain-containing protein, partial [Bacillus toyonensis]
GKHTLDLIVFDADGNIVNDHANWANAKLLP